jgi:hypothetical protein
MAPEPQEPAEQQADGRPVCPDCGHVNIPGAAFCAHCGRSLRDDAPVEVIDVEPADGQATSAFEPVTSTVTAPDRSPWARPDSLAGDAGQTTALPVVKDFIPAPGLEPIPISRAPRGVRGFWLGVIAVLLIVAVLAVYVYAAWLSDSARSTVDGWLPWM